MKVCRECNKEKELHDFYKHSAMADGHLNKCIECVKTRVHKHRESNLDKIREYDKKRAMLPHRVQARREYIQTEAGKEAKKRGIQNYHKKFPMKYAARVITGNAIRDGKLIPQKNCSQCNSDKRIQGHHDDYTKPLEVRWLCEPCHKNWHKFNKAIYE
jgi:hypothetical protein